MGEAKRRGTYEERVEKAVAIRSEYEIAFENIRYEISKEYENTRKLAEQICQTVLSDIDYFLIAEGDKMLISEETLLKVPEFDIDRKDVIVHRKEENLFVVTHLHGINGTEYSFMKMEDGTYKEVLEPSEELRLARIDYLERSVLLALMSASSK